MRIILVVRLIFVVLDPDEVAVDSFWVERESHESVDSCSLRDDLERPGLLVLELDDFVVTANDLIAFILGSFEELRKGKPLTCHLVAIIGVHTVGSISLDSFDCRLTTVQSNNIINKRLSGFVQWEGLGWIWVPVLGC